MANPKTKATMVDNNQTIVTVVFNETAPNELIGEHTVYTSFGTFVFNNGKLDVTKEIADKLKDAGVIK